ncbi:MAG: hypothetical protein R3D25_08835 [Geminicoccaceae bacterium]
MTLEGEGDELDQKLGVVDDQNVRHAASNQKSARGSSMTPSGRCSQPGIRGY